MTATQTHSLGPGALAEAGTPGGPAFSLSKTEWIEIQTYVVDGLALPITDSQFRNSLGPGAAGDLTDFVKLIAAYQGINEHCSTWQKTTFPNTVALASRVYEYGINKAPVYYPPILKEASILQSDPGNQDAKAALKAILSSLEADATSFATEAAASIKQIQDFADRTQADKTILVGADGKSGYLAYYNKEYGSKSTKASELLDDITAQKIVLNAANKEYNQDVVIATTTLTYAWVPLIGLVAAAVVAGVYGDKAVKALARAKAAHDEIAADNDQIEADFNLMLAINAADAGITAIVVALEAALPVVQKIQGVWAGIAQDLASITELIDNDITQALPIIMNLGVEEALKAWHNVGLAADAYRVNAYVNVSGGPAGSMEAWKLDQLISSDRGAYPVLEDAV